MRRTVTLVFAVAVGGCSLHDVKPDPPPPVAALDAFGAEQTSGTLSERWWSSFGDPTLDSLVETALSSNLQLRSVHARLAQATAIARQARSGWWPQISADVGVGRSQQSIQFGPTPTTVETNSFSASLGAAYELDLWRRVGSLVNAADLEYAAGRGELEAAAMTLAANVAEHWFDVVVTRASRALLDSQLATTTTYADLVDLRFREGLTSALDVHQQRTQLAQLKSQQAQIDARLANTSHRLAVLLGKAPRAISLPEQAQLPGLPPPPNVGVPATLLTRRPDVRAAQLRVEAADHRIGAAIADRLPALRLSGSAGFRSTELSSLFDFSIWNLAAGLTAPLLDGGRRAAEVDRSRAVLDERLASFGQTFLVAVREVEDALVLETQTRIQIGDLVAARDAAATTLTEATRRYREGLIEYLPVLTALNASQRSEQSLLTAQRDLLSHRIQLCRALGGTWTQAL